MPFELVVSQGRIADRSPGAIRGAALATDVLRKITGLTPVIVGTPAPPERDDWTASLPEARETLEALQDTVAAIISRGNKPLIVANTCSASLASLPVAAREHPDAIILWIDAHGDFNTPDTTESGYLGGMVLAAACGLWDSGHGNNLDPQRVVLVGARDIDAAEGKLLEEAGVTVLAPEQTTPKTVLNMIGNDPVWIHIDWDVLEPNFVPAAYAVENGLMPDVLKTILAAIPARQIVGIELAEFEASNDPAANAQALKVLGDVIHPLLTLVREGSSSTAHH
ncbi:arginase (plasmid) [Rhizobium sp. ACO-34A]|nr:arginase family protein [Rhizobium sp. ACO-34A]ATN36677.1 arginase [Rhizobium sp. ACO-34A]